MKPLYLGIICTCSACGCNLSYHIEHNVYDGGPWQCGNCGYDVTIDMYGKGIRGYYVQSVTGGHPVFYKWLREADEIANMFGAQLLYAYDNQPVESNH